jgi:16S rRNA (cytidine1402-2'-O)-methyltransferase
MDASAASPSVQGGTLYMVATPLGNLSDITLRALETLKGVDRIACEDTRRTLKLLTHFGIHKPLLSIVAPREERESGKVAWALSKGESVALVTDAGTPGLSDPGHAVVRAVRAAGFPIVPIPGPSASACALSVCGFGENGFVFMGFLHRSPGKIRKELRLAAASGRPILFYESPFRVMKTLALAEEVFGPEARCFIGREMTKKFEEYLEDSLGGMRRRLEGRELLGEFTILIAPPDTPRTA